MDGNGEWGVGVVFSLSLSLFLTLPPFFNVHERRDRSMDPIDRSMPSDSDNNHYLH